MSDAYDLYQQGKSHLRDGLAAQATVALEKAKRLEPEKASIREALGIAYFRITRWAEAEAEFRKVLELSPVDDYAHYALGRALQKQGRLEEAGRHLKLAKCLRPVTDGLPGVDDESESPTQDEAPSQRRTARPDGTRLRSD